MRRDREPLQLHSLNQVGVALILGTLRKRLLLRTKEPRRVRPIRLVEIAGPQIVGLHQPVVNGPSNACAPSQHTVSTRTASSAARSSAPQGSGSSSREPTHFSRKVSLPPTKSCRSSRMCSL